MNRVLCCSLKNKIICATLLQTIFQSVQVSHGPAASQCKPVVTHSNTHLQRGNVISKRSARVGLECGGARTRFQSDLRGEINKVLRVGSGVFDAVCGS